MPRQQRKLLGRYVVADPKICHGKPTFLGTRIMAAQVLKQVGKGMSWDKITAEWRGAVPRDAIVEAVELDISDRTPLTPSTSSSAATTRC